VRACAKGRWLRRPGDPPTRQCAPRFGACPMPKAGRGRRRRGRAGGGGGCGRREKWSEGVDLSPPIQPRGDGRELNPARRSSGLHVRRLVRCRVGGLRACAVSYIYMNMACSVRSVPSARQEASCRPHHHVAREGLRGAILNLHTSAAHKNKKPIMPFRNPETPPLIPP
jgi:hypothetical protein